MPNKKSTRNNKKKQCNKEKSPIEKEKQTLYFWKGSTFPVFMKGDHYNYFNNSSIKMIKDGIKNGYSKEQQIVNYKKDLDIIEKQLLKHCNPYNKQGMKNLCQELGQIEAKISIMWCLNICALLNLNAIPNDNNNGILHLSGDLPNFNML